MYILCIFHSILKSTETPKIKRLKNHNLELIKSSENKCENCKINDKNVKTIKELEKQVETEINRQRDVLSTCDVTRILTEKFNKIAEKKIFKIQGFNDKILTYK